MCVCVFALLEDTWVLWVSHPKVGTFLHHSLLRDVISDLERMCDQGSIDRDLEKMDA